MKTGKTLVELATELQRQKDAKHDYKVDTDVMDVGYVPIEREDGAEDYDYKLKCGTGASQEAFHINSNCHSQIASALDIPKKYYDKMKQHEPALLTKNINTWLHAGKPKKKLIRTLDGYARAFLSDSYRRVDNFDIAEVVLPALQRLNADVVSCDVTEDYLYVKAVCHEITHDVVVGDTVEAGLMIRNSEVGKARFEIRPFSNRLVCLNGMVHDDLSMVKTHLGKKNMGVLDGGFQEWITDHTLALDDAALYSRVKDTIKYFFEKANFEAIVQKMREATEVKIEADPIKVMEVTQKKYRLTENEKIGVLGHLIAGKDLSQYGMAQAVTSQAADVESYDRATQLEKVGGKIIELPRRDFETIVRQAA